MLCVTTAGARSLYTPVRSLVYTSAKPPPGKIDEHYKKKTLERLKKKSSRRASKNPASNTGKSKQVYSYSRSVKRSPLRYCDLTRNPRGVAELKKREKTEGVRFSYNYVPATTRT